MIQELNIRNFQSIAKADLQLGLVTIIVGESNSGKSAVVRAIRTLISNPRGTSFVRNGQGSAVIGLKLRKPGDDPLWDPITVILARGKENWYKLSTGETWTKLGGAVPEEITNVLAIKDDGQPQLAGQFDRPFLLDSTASEVARELSELTNLILVVESAREASGERAKAKRDREGLKTLLDQLEARLPEFQDLPTEKQILELQEFHLQQLRQTSSDLQRLNLLIAGYMTCATALNQPVPTVPDMTQLEEALARRVHLNTLAWELEQSQLTAADEAMAAVNQGVRLQDLEAGYDMILKAAGKCPTCGQQISESHVSHVEGGS